MLDFYCGWSDLQGWLDSHPYAPVDEYYAKSAQISEVLDKLIRTGINNSMSV
jgi:hypothetical protein